MSLLLAMLVQVAETPAPMAVAPPRIDVVAKGTPVSLATVDPLDSRALRQGQRVALRVTADVRIADRLVIPAGSQAVGEIEALSPKGMVGKEGRFHLQPLFVELAGRRLFLEGGREARGKNATTATAATGIILTPLAIFITGKSATLPAGSPVEARVRTDLSLPPLSP